MSYTPEPGSTAYRVLAWLETQPAGSEHMSSQIAEALGQPGVNIVPCLEAAHAHGKIFRRKRDDHVRAPFWWSLTDRSGDPLPARPERHAKALDAGQHKGSKVAQVPHEVEPGPVAASTPTNGRPPARPDPEGAAAIAGRAARPKETAQRGATSIEPHSDAKGAGDDAKPAVGAAAPDGLRVALWSDGWLDLRGVAVTGAGMARLSPDQTRDLVNYLDRLREPA